MAEDGKPVALIGTIKVPIKIKDEKRDFVVHVSAPGPKDSVETLEEALERNRELLVECEKDILDNMKKDFFEYQPPWKLNFEGPVQTALMARLNINVLIPLINIRGGRAKYSKFESFPVERHIQILIGKAERIALEHQIEKSSPFMYAVSVFTAIAVLVVAFVVGTGR